MNRAEIFAAIEKERERQAAKWTREHAWGYGDCSSADVPSIVKVAVLTEECGEVSRAVLDGFRCDDADSLRRELVQVAAVCCAWLEGL